MRKVGHTLRKEPRNITKQTIKWNSQGKRRRGRTEQTWRRSLNCELRNSGLTWDGAKIKAKDRGRWDRVAKAIRFQRSLKD